MHDLPDDLKALAAYDEEQQRRLANRPQLLPAAISCENGECATVLSVNIAASGDAAADEQIAWSVLVAQAKYNPDKLIGYTDQNDQAGRSISVYLAA